MVKVYHRNKNAKHRAKLNGKLIQFVNGEATVSTKKDAETLVKSSVDYDLKPFDDDNTQAKRKADIILKQAEEKAAQIVAEAKENGDLIIKQAEGKAATIQKDAKDQNQENPNSEDKTKEEDKK